MVLEIKDLKIQYKTDLETVYAVNGISLEMEKGETVGLVGETGAGKTTTALGVMGLLPERTARITEGSILFEGQELTRLSDREYEKIRGNKISMIFQDPMSTLNPVYTIGSQIMESLSSHEKIDKAEAKARIIKLLSDLGIPTPEKRYDQYPHEFSGGMKQRVMIAIAMICKPNILIADEPTTALDVTIQAQILDLMQKMQREHGTSIILITHNMGIVAEVADSVAVMYMGRVVEYGTLEQIFTNPLHPYTKALMQSVPVLGMDKTQELETIEGNTPDASTDFGGCEFSDRCECAVAACKNHFPVDTIMDDGHRVRCLLFEEVRVGGK